MEIDPQECSSREMYFRMISTIVPRPIAWVSTLSLEGVANIAPFSFFTGVTSKPPTLVFCAGNRRDGSLKDTVANILERGEFVVNMVHEAMAQAMVQTSAPYAPGVDEFEQAEVASIGSTRVKVPRVKEALVSYECRLNQVVELAHEGVITSRMVIGDIVTMHISDEVLDEAQGVDVERLNPVCRLGGQDYATLGRVFEIPRAKP